MGLLTEQRVWGDYGRVKFWKQKLNQPDRSQQFESGQSRRRIPNKERTLEGLRAKNIQNFWFQIFSKVQKLLAKKTWLSQFFIMFKEQARHLCLKIVKFPGFTWKNEKATVISNDRQVRLKSVPGRRQQLMIKRMIYKYSGKDVRSLGANMGSPGINYYRLKQLENVTDKSYLDFSEVPPPTNAFS